MCVKFVIWKKSIKAPVNKKIEKPSYKVKENDIIELEVEKPKESKLKP